MMSVYCDELGKRVLLDLHAITSISGDYGRITLDYRCICGNPGRLHTGRHQPSGMSGHVA